MGREERGWGRWGDGLVMPGRILPGRLPLGGVRSPPKPPARWRASSAVILTRAVGWVRGWVGAEEVVGTGDGGRQPGGIPPGGVPIGGPPLVPQPASRRGEAAGHRRTPRPTTAEPAGP